MSKEKFTKVIELVTDMYNEIEVLKNQSGSVVEDQQGNVVRNDQVALETLSKLAESYIEKVWFNNWNFPNIKFDGGEFSKTEEDIIKHIRERHGHEFLSDHIANVEVYEVIDPIIAKVYKKVCEAIKEDWEYENGGEN